MRNVGAQGIPYGLRVSPGLGGQHFSALCNEYSSLSLNLSTVLQVFDGLDALSQQHFQPRQRLTRQWRPGFGSITLPGQGIGQIEFWQGQQRLSFVRPLGGDSLLPFGALDVV